MPVSTGLAGEVPPLSSRYMLSQNNNGNDTNNNETGNNRQISGSEKININEIYEMKNKSGKHYSEDQGNKSQFQELGQGFADNQTNHSDNGKNEQIMSSLPSYPLLDTFSLLCILMIFPHWLSTISLILYVFLGKPEFLDSMLLLVLKHKLNRSSKSSSSVSFIRSLSLISFILSLALDSVFMVMIFYFIPWTVPYIILFSKAFMASNLTSLRNRYVLDAFISGILLISLENSMLYSIKHFEIFRGDSLFYFTSPSASTDFLYPLYYKSSTSFGKTLFYYITLHKISENSIIMFQMEYALQFFYSTLSLYIIMHNLNPILRKLAFIDHIYSFIESFAISDSQNEENSSLNFSNETTNISQNNIGKDKTKVENTFQIPKEISSSNLPTLRLNRILDDEFVNKNVKNIEEEEGEEEEQKPVDDESLNTDSNDGSADNDTKIPMWFPEDHQVLNMNDVSSSSYVVAQNFENFCKMIWSSSYNLLSPTSALVQESNISNSNLTHSPLSQSFDSVNNNINNINNNSNNNSTNTSSSNVSSSGLNLQSSTSNLSSRHRYQNLSRSNQIINLSPKRNSSRNKAISPSDKKLKFNLLKYQQPLWIFLNAARTMFSRQDYYSGDYYSQNAVVTTGYGVDDYVRNNNSSSQCFIWFTGETTLAFELHNISLEQLLIKVNGIIWEHVSSCAFFGREMIIINGLSPLSQYDIDFVKITLSGDLVHLTTTTVSTVFQNKTVTESNISSPLATLQRSVVTTQEAIEREKTRLKKMKTDWRKKSSQIKSEIENLNNRSNFSDESRNYKKLDSLRQTVAKSDIEIANLSKKSEEISLLQTEIEEKYLDAKRLYETELRSFTKFENDSKNEILNQEKKLKSLALEKSQLLVKKEKIISKKLRIHHDVELLTNELETLRKTEISLRIERRKIRSVQREEKYKLLVNDIKKIERQLRAKTLNSF